jgi:hypothetical protein
MATPFVTGVAALVLASLSRDGGPLTCRDGEIKDILFSSQQRSSALDSTAGSSGASGGILWGSAATPNGICSPIDAVRRASDPNYTPSASKSPGIDGLEQGNTQGANGTAGTDSRHSCRDLVVREALHPTQSQRRLTGECEVL